MKKFILLVYLVASSYCYLPTGKESFLSGIFLKELLNRINDKDLQNGDISYLDLTDGLPPIGPRSLQRELEEEQMFPLDYEALGDMSLLHPRDQEYTQHSTLWGSQFVSGGAGEGDQLLSPSGLLKNKQEMKTDSTLPAYCNPPNPCPVGYTEDQGCIMDFENTASFSRRYQARQKCMCDSEHMFQCPARMKQRPSMYGFDMGMWPEDDESLKMSDWEKRPSSKKNNPYLSGERLPVAAKKGNKVQ